MPHGERFLNNPVDTTSYRYATDLSLYWHAMALRTRRVAAAQQSSARTYLLDGTPAPDRTRGIVIQDHRKTVRK